MMTFDQALLHLIQEGRVSVEDAMQAVSSVHDFELALQQAGIPLPANPRRRTEPNPDTTAPAGVADVLGGAPTGVEVGS